MRAGDPQRPCRHCGLIAARCHARHDWTGEACCADCKHDWEDQ